MRWQGRRQSANIDDRRRVGPRGMAIGGVGGIGGIVIVALYLLMGGDPATLLNEVSVDGGLAGTGSGVVDPAEQQLTEFVAVVLADTEEVWHALLREEGMTYREPTLVLFRGQVQSACGAASSAVGPFYCPGDEDVYLDLGFFEELSSRFGAPGDFAQAYVIAHEIGHHVQNLLGTSDKMHAMRGRVSEEEYNQLSVRLELQADFLAGVWAHHAHAARDLLEPGDIEEGIRAAGAIGDDQLQMQTQGYVVPDSFTHGTSEQRIEWFLRGFESGKLRDGDTFGADAL